MSADYCVFLRTAESIWKVRIVLAEILNCQLEKRDKNIESFYVSLLGITIWLGNIDDYDKNILFQYKNEVIPLSAYDLRIEIISELRDYEDDWQKSISAIIAKMLCLRLSCESIVVRNYHSVTNSFKSEQSI